MGCDIHLYTEVQVGNEWISVDDWYDEEYDEGEKRTYAHHIYEHRDYGIFGMLAGVRNDSYPPLCGERGLPPDLSKEVEQEADYWNPDGHTPSWYTYDELILTLQTPGSESAERWIQRILKKRHAINSDLEVGIQLALGSISRNDLDSTILLTRAWKDEGVDWDEFAITVTDYLCTQMKEHEAEDARIVFWFDN